MPGLREKSPVGGTNPILKSMNITRTKRTMKTIRLTVGCLLAALLAGACGHDAPSGPGIIPVPQSVEWGKGHFEMPDTLLYGDNLPAS